jgi:TolA-binding protein
MSKISANRLWLLAAALSAALCAGGCLGMSDNPKPHVIRSKVAKTPPPAPAAKDTTKVAKKTAPKTEKAKKPNAPTEDTTASAEPDKLLYERSMTDIKKGHYTEARLSLQNLINT